MHARHLSAVERIKPHVEAQFSRALSVIVSLLLDLKAILVTYASLCERLESKLITEDTDRQTDRHIDGQTDRQTEIETAG